MPRTATPVWCFALVLVRDRGRLLMVHERKYGQVWYVPAGRVEPGETFVAAAHREVMEETGLGVRLDGILRVEHTPAPDGSARLRVVFVASPLDDAPPRDVPNEHTLGARWVPFDEVEDLPLRGPDVSAYLAALRGGAAPAPLALLAAEPQGA